MRLRLALVFIFALGVLRAELTPEQRRLPLEVDSPDLALAKIVLLAGAPSNRAGQHEYFAGCALLKGWLEKAPGVWPVLVANGWPENESVFDGARAFVVFADSGTKLPFLEPGRWARIKTLVERGVGLVMLHQGPDVPAPRAAEMRAWLGAVWEPDIGCRGHWDMEFSDLPKHPVTEGVSTFAAPGDGWLFNLKFDPRAVPVLAGRVPASARTTTDAQTHADRLEVIAWAFERANGGRSFGFTGADLHRHWGIESQRRLVTNAILWTAQREIPKGGANVPLEPADLTANLDAKARPTSAKKSPAAKK